MLRWRADGGFFLHLSLSASTSPLVVQKRSVRSRCQCSLPCCITGTSTSFAIWPRVTWTLAASEEPRRTSPVALTTQCIHRGSQPLSSSIFRSRSGNFLSICVVLLPRTIVWPNRMLRWGHTSFTQAVSAEAVNPGHLVDCEFCQNWVSLLFIPNDTWKVSWGAPSLGSFFLLLFIVTPCLFWFFFVFFWPVSALSLIWPFVSRRMFSNVVFLLLECDLTCLLNQLQPCYVPFPPTMKRICVFALYL